MKYFSLLALLFSLSTTSITQGDQLMKNELHYDLTKPLLIIKENNGFLACAYINPETCNKTGEACAIVSGVSNYDDMKNAKVVAISNAASNLGVSVGDSGQEALDKFK